MYNIGIVVSRGKIVVLCDSDAIVGPTFVENIIKKFKKNPNIALHLDEVRNIDKRFYPFNYPTIEEIKGEGCINWANGLTTGLRELKDLIHSRNYGACMCALREDLIDTGGADEHIDYLGHICGPYELTFRLVNKGKKEVWHKEEFLYHAWHLGSDGLNNYLGPHDGKNVSSLALEAKITKRISPLVENAAIKHLRLGDNNTGVELLLDKVINKDLLKEWVIDENKFLISLGRVAYHRKEYGEALKHWRKVSGHLASDGNFLGEFGWATYFNAEYDEAIRIFNDAIEANGNNQLALVGSGWAHIQKGKFREAEKIFKNVLKNKSSGSCELLNDAKRGLGLALDSLRKADYSIQKCVRDHSKGKLMFILKRMHTALQFYSFKVAQRIKRKNYSIPNMLKNKMSSAFLGNILKINQKSSGSIPEVSLTKGEAEYATYGAYPCDLPVFKVRPDLDFLLLEIPPRYMPMMPNGLAYVNNILVKSGINFQTIDMNIVAYHRYHERRLRERLNHVPTPSGYKMPEDPWENTNMGGWDRPEVIAYFMSELEELIAEIERNKPKSVGISLNGNNRSLVKMFLEELRRRMPGIVVVVGGYDCVYYGTGQHLFPGFEYMLIGEAELTLEPLVKALARGEKPKDLIGIVSIYDSPNHVWKKTPLLNDLDEIDFPRYEWANHSWYQDCERKHLIPITSSRGCNWSKCRFCGECFPFRKRSPVKVVDEIEYHTKFGFHTFHFNESDVNGDPQTLFDICSEVIRRNLNLKFMGQLRINRRNSADYLKHLARAGFTHLRFGVDGWTDNLIKLQNKGYNMEIVFQNLHDCHVAGITTTVNMVIGVPGETESDVDMAIENITMCKDYISVVESFNTLLLVYGSEYYRNSDKYKIRFRDDKEKIYRKYKHYVPSELWYSEDPYIDQDVRTRRLERTISELHKNGVNIGSFAAKVVEDLRSGVVVK